MPENESNPLKYFLDKLSLATEIVSPEQLFALAVLVLLALYFIRQDITIPAFFIIVVLGLYNIGKSRNQRTDEEEVPILELPTDLKLRNDLYDRLKDPLTSLNLVITHGAKGTLWGEDCYYTEARNNQKNIGLISFDNAFFKYGDIWKTGRWFNTLTQIPEKKFSDLVIFSDTEMICQEALYEMEDVKKRDNTRIVLFTKIYLDQFLKASTPEDLIIKTFKLHLDIP